MLPQVNGGEMKKLFEDDDDVDETELFRSPIKSKKFQISLSRCLFTITLWMITESNLQPYYDDERDPMCDTEEDEDSEDEIVMVNRGGVVKGADSDSN